MSFKLTIIQKLVEAEALQEAVRKAFEEADMCLEMPTANQEHQFTIKKEIRALQDEIRGLEIPSKVEGIITRFMNEPKKAEKKEKLEKWQKKIRTNLNNTCWTWKELWEQDKKANGQVTNISLTKTYRNLCNVSLREAHEAIKGAFEKGIYLKILDKKTNSYRFKLNPNPYKRKE